MAPMAVGNLSASMAQHPLVPPITDEELRPGSKSQVPNVAEKPTREFFLDAGRNWARNAYRHAKEARQQDTTGECDQACAAALCHLGDISIMAGDFETARRSFTEAAKLSSDIKYHPALAQAEAGLRILAERQSK